MKIFYGLLFALFLIFPIIGSAEGKIKMEKIKIYDASKGKVTAVEKINKTGDEWKKVLTPEQYDITVKKGTEKAGTCALLSNKEKGIYRCLRCGTDLFQSGAKFESGTGWPSYFQPISDLNIKVEPDAGHGINRTEVLCARCGAHLGHVFSDGPLPTGLRYCINGAALKFRPGNFHQPEKAEKLS